MLESMAYDKNFWSHDPECRSITRNTQFSLLPLQSKSVSATVPYFRPCFPVCMCVCVCLCVMCVAWTGDRNGELGKRKEMVLKGCLRGNELVIEISLFRSWMM